MFICEIVVQSPDCLYVGGNDRGSTNISRLARGVALILLLRVVQMSLFNLFLGAHDIWSWPRISYVQEKDVGYLLNGNVILFYQGKCSVHLQTLGLAASKSLDLRKE